MNKMYYEFEQLDKHASLKTRNPCAQLGTFYKKKQLYNKNKSHGSWELYRKHNNLVTKIKKNSTKTYFYERCIGGPQTLQT